MGKTRDIFSEIFIDNLRRRRKEKFPTQDDFADLVGLSGRSYQRYEQGKSPPTLKLLVRFSEVLECKPWELIAPPDAFKVEKSLTLAKQQMQDLVNSLPPALSEDEQKLLNIFDALDTDARKQLINHAEKLAASNKSQGANRGRRRS